MIDIKILAIQWIWKIQNGEGVDRTQFPESMKGEIAKKYWDDSLFTYGIEYGVILALMEVFGIGEKDL